MTSSLKIFFALVFGIYTNSRGKNHIENHKEKIFSLMSASLVIETLVTPEYIKLGNPKPACNLRKEREEGNPSWYFLKYRNFSKTGKIALCYTVYLT